LEKYGIKEDADSEFYSLVSSENISCLYPTFIFQNPCLCVTSNNFSGFSQKNQGMEDVCNGLGDHEQVSRANVAEPNKCQRLCSCCS
jgi:hypothetical protein